MSKHLFVFDESFKTIMNKILFFIIIIAITFSSGFYIGRYKTEWIKINDSFNNGSEKNSIGEETDYDNDAIESVIKEVQNKTDEEIENEITSPKTSELHEQKKSEHSEHNDLKKDEPKKDEPKISKKSVPDKTINKSKQEKKNKSVKKDSDTIKTSSKNLRTEKKNIKIENKKIKDEKKTSDNKIIKKTETAVKSKTQNEDTIKNVINEINK
ncbi:hypothetical protein KA977_08695 [Candidatus Dependentiae bacterium]|nr:hypothetical protein [Candidatus Dependentiae bacterium]